MPWIAVCLVQLDSSAQAVIAQTCEAVPERALQLAADVGRGCSGWASGVLGGVDRRLSGSASHSSAQAVIAQTPAKWSGQRTNIAAIQKKSPVPIQQ